MGGGALRRSGRASMAHGPQGGVVDDTLPGRPTLRMSNAEMFLLPGRPTPCATRKSRMAAALSVTPKRNERTNEHGRTATALPGTGAEGTQTGQTKRQAVETALLDLARALQRNE